ncbi:hypothetical protein Taro_055500, partial [Colocasia esculenta]|nr:hypothetical protein [Colocasia esculenta]
ALAVRAHSTLSQHGEVWQTIERWDGQWLTKRDRTVWWLILHATLWMIWGKRNNRIFLRVARDEEVPCRVDTPEDCAKLINANLSLGLGNGILIAVPIPREHAASGNLIESAIQKALEEARNKNIMGNAATPFLLARVNELTHGASLIASIL